MQQKFSLIQTIAESVVAVIAMLAIVLRWPMLRSHAALVRDLQAERRANSDLRRALDLVKLGNEAMQIAIDGLTAEVKAVADRLDGVDSKWKLGIAYICELLEHHEVHGGAGDLPPIPAQLRDDIADARAQLRSVV